MPDSTFGSGVLDTFLQPQAGDKVGPVASGGKDHAMEDRAMAQVLQELEQRSQLARWAYSIIQTSTTYASGTIARNMRTGEQEFGPDGFHNVFNSVSAALQSLAEPGGMVSIATTKADNTSIKTRDVLQGWDGMHLAAFGYAKRGQTGTGHPDVGVVLEGENGQFPGGAKAVLDITTGTGPLDSWFVDGVSIEANSEADCAIRAAATIQGPGSLFRLNLRGGIGDTLRLGEKGWTDCGLVRGFHLQVSHNDSGADSLVGAYAGDLLLFYCNPATNSAGAQAILVDTEGHVRVFFGHDAGGGSAAPGIKVVRCATARFGAYYHDNQEDHVHGGYWLAPSASGDIGIVEILHGRVNANDDGTGCPPLVTLDGGGAGRGIPMVRVHGLFSKGNKLTGGTPALVPAIVRAINGFDAGSVVAIEDCDVMQASAVWDTDGSTGWAPAFTWGNQISPTLASNGQVMGEQVITGTMTGTSKSFAHKCYGTPEYAKVTARGATPAAGELSVETTPAAAIVHSTASEPGVAISIRLKMLGS